jgi:hypothetical protein
MPVAMPSSTMITRRSLSGTAARDARSSDYTTTHHTSQHTACHKVAHTQPLLFLASSYLPFFCSALLLGTGLSDVLIRNAQVLDGGGFYRITQTDLHAQTKKKKFSAAHKRTAFIPNTRWPLAVMAPHAYSAKQQQIAMSEME